MQVITRIILMFYASIASNTSKYSHSLHDFMRVITNIICIIHNIRMTKIFKYFESNNNALQVMQVSSQVEADQYAQGLAMGVYKYFDNVFDIQPC